MSITVTVIYTGINEPIVHAHGCADVKRDAKIGTYNHATESFEADDLVEVADTVYADQIEESESDAASYVGFLDVKPCVRF